MEIYAKIEKKQKNKLYIPTKLCINIVAQFYGTIKVRMFKFIDKIISEFRICFTRTATFKWFAVILIGFIVRSDSMGVTSVIRDLCIDGRLYSTMMHFFRSSAWSLTGVFRSWCHVVLKFAPLMRDNDGSVILVGDGTKISKEAKHMPGVKKHHQDSENSGKASYIFGHLFGCIGILASNTNKILCIPLLMTIQDGVKKMFAWNNTNERQGSHVEQIIEDACRAASIVGKAILLLDRYFLTTSALLKISRWNADNPDKQIKLVTKTKANVTAYEKPEKQHRRGRPRKKGATVHLKELFGKQELFKDVQVFMYGKQETVKYYAVNLLWKQGLYQELRFVLVQYKDVNSILVTTDLSMEAEAVIRMYSHRFNIECTFKTMKQLIGVGCYHFWSKHMPKLNKYGETDISALSEEAKNKILEVINAIEKYVMICCIATGTLQILLLTHSSIVSPQRLKYRRTISSNTPTEDVLADYLRRNLFRFMDLCPDLGIIRFIMPKQHKNEELSADMVA